MYLTVTILLSVNSLSVEKTHGTCDVIRNKYTISL